MIEISTNLNEYRLQGVINFLAVGATNAKVLIYDGTRPAFGDAATTLLCEVTLVEPLGTLSGGVLTMTPTDEYLNAATGTATWARVINGDGTIGWDCDVSDMLGSGDIKLASTTLYAGGYTRIVSGTLG